MQGWRAYYDGGRVFDSDNDLWHDIPQTGVLLVVVFEEPPYRWFIDSADWYYLHEGQFLWVPSQEWDGTYRIKPRGGGICRECVKQGVMVSDAEMQQIIASAWVR